jgi:hypothetical protein
VLKLFIGFAVPLFVLCPLIVGLKGYKKFDTTSKLVIYYLIVAALANLVAVSLALNHNNNMPIFHVFTVLEFILLSLFFQRLTSHRLTKKILTFCIISFSVFSIINIIYIEPITTYNSLTRSVESILLIVFSLFSFYKGLEADQAVRKKIKHLLWIHIGLICYFSGSLFLFIFSEWIAKDVGVYRVGWIIHAILVTFLYSMLTTYLLKAKRI